MFKQFLLSMSMLFLGLSFTSAAFTSQFVDVDTQTQTRYQSLVDGVYTPYVTANSTKEGFVMKIATIRNTLVKYINDNELSDTTFYALEYLVYRMDMDIDAYLLAAQVADTAPVQPIVPTVEDPVEEETIIETTDDTTQTEEDTTTESDISLGEYREGDKNILAGDITGPIAKFELIAQYEDIQIQELSIQASSDDFYRSVAQVYLYDDKGMLVGTDIPNGNTVTFDNLEIFAPEGQSELYIAVETNPIGQERIGFQTDSFTFSLDILQAEGLNSGRLTNVSMQNSMSETITIVPMLISNIDIVSEWKNRVIEKTLFDFDDETNLGILLIETAPSNTRYTHTQTEVDTLIEEITVEVNDGTVAGNIASTLKIRRFDSTTETDGVVNADGTVTFDIGLLDDDAIIRNGETGAFLIIGTPTLDDTTTESVRIDLKNTNNGGIVYSTTDVLAPSFDVLNLLYVDHDGVSLRD